MTDEILASNRVLLTASLTVRNLKRDLLILSCVDEAVKFLDANFSLGQRADAKWQHTTEALQIAAATDGATQREYATKAVIALLHLEGMLERHWIPTAR